MHAHRLVTPLERLGEAGNRLVEPAGLAERVPELEERVQPDRVPRWWKRCCALEDLHPGRVVGPVERCPPGVGEPLADADIDTPAPASTRWLDGVDITEGGAGGAGAVTIRMRALN